MSKIMHMILTRRRALAAGAAGAALLYAPQLLARPAPLVLSGEAFGSGWRITLTGAHDAALIGPGVVDILARIDAQMSPWRADSDVTRFNRAGAGGMAVPEPLAEVAQAALRVARDSGGAFDPTVGPLVARLGLGPIEGDGRPGYAGLAAQENELRKDRAGLTFDPCGIAKGYALDRLGDYLLAKGVGDFLIELGGDLLARGVNGQGQPWRVGVEAPSGAGLAARLALRDRAVATSGLYAQGYVLGGVAQSHIIDPAALGPVAGGPVSVTVAAARGVDADGWATALMAAGAGAEGLARGAGLDALILAADGGQVVTGAMGAMLEGA
ncbi:MAG: FAD:protein FMN transferase [Paracoccus sp. (in: a-proteobacteria)]|nr:FAD:protein FMN transferase [Paracoccus sp. (in: a-proteobacteria)]